MLFRSIASGVQGCPSNEPRVCLSAPAYYDAGAEPRVCLSQPPDPEPQPVPDAGTEPQVCLSIALPPPDAGTGFATPPDAGTPADAGAPPDAGPKPPPRPCLTPVQPKQK